MTPPHIRERHGAHGFTLIEVLCGVMLFGVVGAVAASNFSAYMPAYRVRGAALEIAGDMNQARLGAIKEGRAYYYVPVAGGIYDITFQNGAVQTLLKRVEVAKDYPEVRFAAPTGANDPYGTPITAAVPAGPITFNSDGTVSNPAGVYVSATDTTLHSHHAVVVTAAGRIRAWSYSGTTWK